MGVERSNHSSGACPLLASMLLRWKHLAKLIPFLPRIVTLDTKLQLRFWLLLKRPTFWGETKIGSSPKPIQYAKEIRSQLLVHSVWNKITLISNKILHLMAQFQAYSKLMSLRQASPKGQFFFVASNELQLVQGYASWVCSKRNPRVVSHINVLLYK